MDRRRGHEPGAELFRVIRYARGRDLGFGGGATILELGSQGSSGMFGGGA